jgi:hypothetical protein
MTDNVFTGSKPQYAYQAVLTRNFDGAFQMLEGPGLFGFLLSDADFD